MIKMRAETENESPRRSDSNGRTSSKHLKLIQARPRMGAASSSCLWQISKIITRKSSPISSLMLLCCLSFAYLMSAQLAVQATQEISNAALAPPNRAALEAELNSLLQQHDGSIQDASGKLSEAIISHLMLGNLSESLGGAELGSESLASRASLSADEPSSAAAADLEQDQQQLQLQQQQQQALSGPDALRLRRLMSYLHSYEMAQAASGGQAFSQYPILPAGQASTIKRAASVKIGNHLMKQSNGRQAYNRNNFDFGLGKRPDSSVANNILRFGDSSMAGHVVSGSYGKRPSGPRFDFGLGKRVASPAYPRYDFGLGKRAPNRIRYDFGLGK